MVRKGRPNVPPAGEFWRRAYRAAEEAAARWTAAATSRQAIVQEAIVRLFVRTRRRPAPGDPDEFAALIGGIVRHVALDRFRREKRAPVSLDLAGSLDPLAAELGPADTAELGELLRRVRIACAALPPPYQQIAALRLRGATRRRIAEYLHGWRGVGPEEARRLGKRTVAMLRLALAGIDLPGRFPRRFSKENVWNTTPPPSFRDREVGGSRWSSNGHLQRGRRVGIALKGMKRWEPRT